MGEMHFVRPLHTNTNRNYLDRVNGADKASCATVAKQWDFDYWDGDRKYGYGGYQYDGRWAEVAQKIVEHYHLKDHAKILDIGCGKGYLLYEIKQILPNAEVVGLDISYYALSNAKPEIKSFLILGNATQLPFNKQVFDLVYTITTLHNLYIFDFKRALGEINRVKKQHAYFLTESYRNEHEKMNLLYWQLTCEAFFSYDEWLWLFEEYHYTGDYEFIYFE